MFNPIRALARPMLASMFIMGGLDALKTAQQKAQIPEVDEVARPVAEQVPVLEQFDTETLVKINGAAQVAGGIALAFGKLPRLSSAVLAATLIPTTVAGHRFWEESDDGVRANQQAHFMKNLSMLGGLLLSALDREGRPSAAWRAKHATEHAGIRAEQVKRESALGAAAAAAKAQAKTADVRAKGKVAKERAAIAGTLAKAKAKEAAADARLKGAVTAERAKKEIEHQRDTIGTKAELAKKKLIPDAENLLNLVTS